MDASFGSGDGWVRCSLGHKHWGLYGAAGLLVRHRDPSDGSEWVLLQHRAGWSHHGGTWGVPGGARNLGESARAAALREAGEESDLDLESLSTDGEDCYVDDHGGWTYTTVVLRTPAAPPVAVRGEESTELRWVRLEGLHDLELHPGFAGTWPRVRELGA